MVIVSAFGFKTSTSTHGAASVNDPATDEIRLNKCHIQPPPRRGSTANLASANTVQVASWLRGGDRVRQSGRVGGEREGEREVWGEEGEPLYCSACGHCSQSIYISALAAALLFERDAAPCQSRCRGEPPGRSAGADARRSVSLDRVMF